MRWDDFSTVMSSGPRSGQYVLQNVRTRIKANGITFTQCHADDGTCAPGRASFVTGMYASNHGIGPGNTTDDYYDNYRTGVQAQATTGTGARVARWIGPWEFDRAAQNGYADTPLAPGSQGSVGGRTFVAGHGYTRTNTNQRGDNTTPDDLQAFTGSLATWLEKNGVRCGLVGKYQNAYADQGHSIYTTPAQTNLFVPPGWRWWTVLCGSDFGYNGGAQDHWRVHTTEFSGANSGTGNGTTGTEVAYRYDLPIQTITWAAASGSTPALATVTIDPTLGRTHNLTAGDEVHVEGVNYSGYNSTVGTVGFTVYDTPTAYSFRYPIAVNPGGAGSNAVGQVMTCYPRPNFGDVLWGRKAVDFVNSCTHEEPWFLYLAPDNPHGGQNASGATDDTHERERRYMNSVDPARFSDWNGVSGAISPATIGANANTNRKLQWQQRQEMLASTDDAIGAVLDACEARGWTNVAIIFTSDNGFQIGEQEVHLDSTGTDIGEGSVVWDQVGGKGFIWEGSVRIPLVIRHPSWAKNFTADVQVTQADICPTIMDIFGFTTHHVHTKRDGVSITRLLSDRFNPSASYYNRATLLTRGEHLNNSWEGLWDRQGRKLVRAKLAPTTRMVFNAVDDTNYEMTDMITAGTITAGDVTTLAARLDVLRDCRWDGTSNTCRTA